MCFVFQLREAKAIARQARVNSLDGVSSIEEDHSPQGKVFTLHHNLCDNKNPEGS